MSSPARIWPVAAVSPGVCVDIVPNIDLSFWDIVRVCPGKSRLDASFPNQKSSIIPVEIKQSSYNGPQTLLDSPWALTQHH